MSKALLFAVSGQAPDWIAHQQILSIEIVTVDGPLHQYVVSLADEPVVALIPVDESDMGSVKTLRALRDSHPKTVVAAYCNSVPCPAFVAYAFREGLADMLFTTAGAAETAFRLGRLARLLKEREAAHLFGAAQAEKMDELIAREHGVDTAKALWEQRSVRLVNACRLVHRGLVSDGSVAVVCSSEVRRESVVSGCERLGIRAKSYDCGAAFLGALSTGVPSVILCDGVLDDIDVVTLIKKMRHDKEARETYVIAWSSDNDFGPGSGVDDCTRKTSHPDGIELALASILVGLGGMRDAS